MFFGRTKDCFLRVKGILAIIVTVCLLLSLTQVLMFSTFANDSSKKMLHVNHKADDAPKIGIKINESDITAGEYTVEFKYNFKKGSLCNTIAELSSATDGAAFCFFSKTENDTQSEMAYLKCSALNNIDTYTYREINTVKTAYDFSLSQKDFDNCIGEFYAGFYLKGSPEFYISDMVMYKVGDKEKTNILPENPTSSNWKYLFYKYPSNGKLPNGTSYITYDEDLFVEAALPKKMLHVNHNADNGPKIGIKINKSEISTGGYTVEFKYNFKKGSLCNTISELDSETDGAAFCFFSKTENDTQSEMAYLKCSALRNISTYTFREINTAKVAYDFSVSQKDLDDCIGEFYAGFYIKGSPEFYISDMAMYKTKDKTKTNILPENPNASNWKYLVYKYPSNGKLPTGSAYELYDAVLFVEEALPKKMLHINHKADDAPKIGIIIDKSEITTGEYTVEFKYNFKKGSLCNTISELDSATDGAAFSFFSKTENGTQSEMAYLKCSALKNIDTYNYREINTARVAYTFSLSQKNLDECIGEFYTGFYLKGVPEFYISDMVMYKTDDNTKTNILPENPNASNWKYLVYKYPSDGKLPAGSAYEAYDSTLFAEEALPKKMLHINHKADDAPKMGIRINKSEITEGEYTVEFKYTFKNGSLCNTVSELSSATDGAAFCFFSKTENDTQSEMAYLKCSALKNIAAYNYREINTAKVAYDFSVSSEDLDACIGEFYVGFYLTGSPDLYIYDMVMYKTDDEEKTNILPENPNASDWKYLVYKYPSNGKLPAGTAYEDYDETLFIEEDLPKKMLHINHSSDVAQKFGIKINKSDIDVGDYTVEFKYNIVKGLLCNTVDERAEAEDAITFCFFSKTENDTQSEMAYLKCSAIQNVGKYKYTGIDTATASYDFSLDEEDFDSCLGEFYVGFFISGTPEFYVSDIVMYKTEDQDKTNILPENPNASNWKYLMYKYATNGQLPPGTEYLECDDSLFVGEPIPVYEKMLYVAPGGDDSFFGTALAKGTIKPDVEYAVSFKYHFETRELDEVVACALMYYDKNKSGNGNTITSITKRVNSNPAVALQNDFLTKFKDGANALYTFKLEKDDIDTANDQFFIGFTVNPTEEDFPVFYLYDFKIYEVADSNKTNLINIDTYFDDPSIWVGNWGSYKMSPKRKYLNYDSSLFLPTSKENLYIDIEFKGNDGEWWNPKDIFSLEDNYKASVKGRVTDQNGKPIKDVKLILQGEKHSFTATSNKDGYFSFINVPIDFYELFIIDANNEKISTGFYNNFSDGDTAQVSVVCDNSKGGISEAEPISGGLKGDVYTPERKTVQSIKIYLDDFGEVITDKNGHFEFQNVPSGEYKLYTILDSGKKYVFRTVKIKDGVNLSVKLQYAVSDKQVSQKNYYPLIISLSALFLLIVGTVTVFVIKKKRNKAL